MNCSTCSFSNTYPSYSSGDGYDWLHDLPDTTGQYDLVEVKFKSTRKEFFRNQHKLSLKRGDKVVVSMNQGHDIGEVSLTGYLADKQFKRKVLHPSRYSTGLIYRIAGSRDLEILSLAKSREKELLIRSRQIASKSGLEMKIGDVEVMADNRKAIFYYIADGRVDFRQLIREYASAFSLKIEMKQIGARQEAGRVGGIGSCGRELCCSSWRTSLTSVSAGALAWQGLSASAQKMAGQCGKLKCCLMYEIDAYIEAGKEFPEELLILETASGIARPLKTDPLARKIWYTLDNNGLTRTVALPLDEVRQHIQANKRGIRPALHDLRPGDRVEEEFITGGPSQQPGKVPRTKDAKGHRRSRREQG